MTEIEIFRAIAEQHRQRAEDCYQMAGWADVSKAEKRALMIKARVYRATATQLSTAISLCGSGGNAENEISVSTKADNGRNTTRSTVRRFSTSDMETQPKAEGGL